MREVLERKGVLAVSVLFILFIFFIPISPSLKSIFFGLAILSLLLTPTYNKLIPGAYTSLWGKIATLFFLFILIACLWSPAPLSMQLSVVGKYCKLIYLPILAVGFINPKVRQLSIYSYLAAMFVTCIISILKFNQIIPSVDAGEVFYNHIGTGFMMAFACYLTGLFACKYEGWQRVLNVSLMVLMSYQVLFINTGRTGYIIYFILMSFLLVQKLTFKKALLGVALLSSIIGITYSISTTMQVRVGELISDVHFLQQNNPNTSLGFRIQFHDYAHSLWEKSPIFGIGTGGFKYSFSKDQPIPTWGTELTDPHSQYWLTLTEQGIVGMALLILFLMSLLISSLKLQDTRPIILGILISFCVGCISDSILCYSAAGYLLIVMCALCFGELIEKRVHKTVNEPESTPIINGVPV